jgi:3-phenylpropionate/cinnamic acid dioxygenase small subunit
MLDEATTREIERFLYREARLLDERRFHECLELLAPDLHYRMSSRPNRYPRSSKAIAMLDRENYREEDPADAAALALFDDTKETLAARVARLDTGMAWAEDPPSRTRHFISNIEVAPGDGEGEVRVRCNYLVYRSRGETEQDFYVGAREDLLRRIDGAWIIARRRLVLDQNVLLAKNLSSFF